MPISDRSNEQTVAHLYNASLCAAAGISQRTHKVLSYWLAKKPRSALIPVFRSWQQRNAERLWDLLEEPLFAVAGRWAYWSGMANDMQPDCHPSYRTQRDVQWALAMHAFGSVLDALTRLKIDPSDNLLGCLTTIAERSLAREHYEIYRRKPAELEPLPDAVAQQFAEEVADPDSDEVYERVRATMAAQHISGR